MLVNIILTVLLNFTTYKSPFELTVAKLSSPSLFTAFALAGLFLPFTVEWLEK
jgi:hypothetical protein